MRAVHAPIVFPKDVLDLQIYVLQCAYTPSMSVAHCKCIRDVALDVSHLAVQHVSSLMHSLCLTDRSTPLRRLGIRAKADDSAIFPVILRTILCFAATLQSVELLVTLYTPDVDLDSLFHALGSVRNLQNAVLRLETGSSHIHATADGGWHARNASGVSTPSLSSAYAKESPMRTPVCTVAAFRNVHYMMNIHRLVLDLQHLRMFDPCTSVLSHFTAHRANRGHWTELYFCGQDLRDNAQVPLSRLMALPRTSVHLLPTINMSHDPLSLRQFGYLV